MAITTPNLNLTYLVPSQSQPEVPINDAWNKIDAAIHSEAGTSLPLTTKGDLVGFDTVPDRVPVGTDGNVLTADSTQPLGVRWAAVVASGGGGSGTANVTPDTHPSSATIWDDEFEYGSAIDTAGSRFAGASPWTAFNAVGITAAVSQGSLLLSNVSNSSAMSAGYVQPISGSTWAYQCKVALATGSNALQGMMLATSAGATGKLLLFAISNSSGVGLIVQQLNNATSFSGNAYVSGSVNPLLTNTVAYPSVYLRIDFNGTNLNFSISASGVAGTFGIVHSETPAAFLGTPAFIGLSVGSPVNGAIYDWFRKAA